MGTTIGFAPLTSDRPVLGAHPERDGARGRRADGRRELKEQDGGPILVAGSSTLMHTLLSHGLVDELRLMV